MKLKSAALTAIGVVGFLTYGSSEGYAGSPEASGRNQAATSKTSGLKQRQGRAYDAPFENGTIVTFAYTEGYPQRTYHYCGVIKSWSGTYEITGWVWNNYTLKHDDVPFHNIPHDSIVEGCQLVD
ncbi:hypothetical protein DXZ20_24610 [Leptolyngbyaceae cyanobacterium CCMR0081]|uniref:Uncharacterized protein n=1 Tax=Adonisia turfae CCMR0081 TaxID=2292702 RepID=A0A6M0RSG5_9CYAN|nr:hypothetical protein [Adonisia turfae CCMR0081]